MKQVLTPRQEENLLQVPVFAGIWIHHLLLGTLFAFGKTFILTNSLRQLERNGERNKVVAYHDYGRELLQGKIERE